VNLNKLPNPELIGKLYREYYEKEGTPEAHVSSHWREFSCNFKIEVDTDGLPSEMVGYGFGDLEMRSLPYQALSLGAVLVKMAVLANRMDLIRMIVVAWPLSRRMGLSFTQDAFRQVCSLTLIKQNLSKVQQQKPIRVLIIGDGYGFLASLFKETFPNSRIVLVDLGKVLLFQAYYCQRAHPTRVHRSVLEDGWNSMDEGRCDFVYCPTECLSKVSHVSYDVAVNIASMQEMTTNAVANYFLFLRKHMNTDGLFYCCNRERKVLVGGEIQEFTRYPWYSEDVHLVDERCPWHKYYLSFSTSSNGPKLLGCRVPLMNYFDGPTWHRLTRLRREH
jgi:hypothetical protein